MEIVSEFLEVLHDMIGCTLVYLFLVWFVGSLP